MIEVVLLLIIQQLPVYATKRRCGLFVCGGGRRRLALSNRPAWVTRRPILYMIRVVQSIRVHILIVIQWVICSWTRYRWASRSPTMKKIVPSSVYSTAVVSVELIGRRVFLLLLCCLCCCCCILLLH